MLGVFVTSMQTAFGRIIRIHEAREGALGSTQVKAFVEATGLTDEMIVLGVASRGVALLGGPPEFVARYRDAAASDGIEFVELPIYALPSN